MTDVGRGWGTLEDPGRVVRRAKQGTYALIAGCGAVAIGALGAFPQLMEPQSSWSISLIAAGGIVMIMGLIGRSSAVVTRQLVLVDPSGRPRLHAQTYFIGDTIGNDHESMSSYNHYGTRVDFPDSRGTSRCSLSVLDGDVGEFLTGGRFFEGYSLITLSDLLGRARLVLRVRNDDGSIQVLNPDGTTAGLWPPETRGD